jgi:hypothetical protein
MSLIAIEVGTEGSGCNSRATEVVEPLQIAGKETSKDNAAASAIPKGAISEYGSADKSAMEPFYGLRPAFPKTKVSAIFKRQTAETLTTSVYQLEPPFIFTQSLVSATFPPSVASEISPAQGNCTVDETDSRPTIRILFNDPSSIVTTYQ